MRGPLPSRAGVLAALLVCLAAALAAPVAPPVAPPVGSAASPADPRLAAFLAAGGTLADICGEAGHGAGGERHCDACLLLGPALLPGSGRSAPSPVAMAAEPAAAAATAPRAEPRLANPPRAPPLRC